MLVGVIGDAVMLQTTTCTVVPLEMYELFHVRPSPGLAAGATESAMAVVAPRTLAVGPATHVLAAMADPELFHAAVVPDL